MATCPYCSGALKKQPQRKTRCPACRQFIFVKSTPDNRKSRPMTESEACAAEEAWVRYHEDQHAWRALDNLDLPINAIELAKARAGNAPREAALAVARDKALKGDRNAVLACISLSVKEPERTAWRKLLHEMDLAKLKRQGVLMVQLVGLKERHLLCAACSALVGKIVPTDMAMIFIFSPTCSCAEKGRLVPCGALRGDDGTYAFAINPPVR